MTLHYAFYENFKAAHYSFTIYYHQRACLDRNLTMLHTRVESLSFRDCKLFISFSLQAPEWGYSKRVAFFGEVESSWRWTLLHDVLRRRFLEIYNFRNWSATHGYVFIYTLLKCRSKKKRLQVWMIVWNKFLASFCLQIACLIALARRSVACVRTDCSCTHTALIFITQTYVRWWSWKMCNKRPHKTIWAAWSDERWETSLYFDLSKQFNTFSDYPVIVPRILLILHAGSISSLSHSSRFIRSFCVCIITPPEAWDGDWIENWVFSFRISRNIQSKKCANNGWLKGKVKR